MYRFSFPSSHTHFVCICYKYHLRYSWFLPKFVESVQRDDAIRVDNNFEGTGTFIGIVKDYPLIAAGMLVFV